MKMKYCLWTVTLLLQCLIAVAVANENVFADVYKEIEDLKKLMGDLAKQVMMQQFFVEERVRSEGYSGVKIVRSGGTGLKNYNSATHLNPKVFAIHDHSDYDRTIGMGEMAVVMNGVEFRTRHNDYKLVMPSTKSHDYNALENIPFPDVPPEVLAKPTVQEQITEMREWFKAFHTQDKSTRDYTKYFKPIMCYIEAGWRNTNDFMDPFPSDRHELEANSWDELHQKNRFIAHTGVRNRKENIAFLPTTIISVDEHTGIPTYAQWSYRIICSPINFDIPLSYLVQQDDLSYRVSSNVKESDVSKGRAARYKLYDGSRNQHFGLLDKIFSEIPGKDNFGGNLSLATDDQALYEDSSFGATKNRLNMAYYHRAYKTYKPSDSSTLYSAFGFNDENLFIALTTKDKIMPIQSEKCFNVFSSSTEPSKFSRDCMKANVRVTYALPLEIIYLNPLLSWNPYNFTYNWNHKQTVIGGKNGRTEASAFSGLDKFRYYQTPFGFFTGKLDSSDPADTVKGFTWVANATGSAFKCAASGVRILMQEISGIGTIRLRYPVAPVHGEGSSVWKELNALKDKVKKNDNDSPTIAVLQTSVTVQNPPGEHMHDIMITIHEYRSLLAGSKLNVTTLEAQGHTHDLEVSYSDSLKKFAYESCDGATECWDGHLSTLTLVTSTSPSAK